MTCTTDSLNQLFMLITLIQGIKLAYRLTLGPLGEPQTPDNGPIDSKFGKVVPDPILDQTSKSLFKLDHFEKIDL